MPGVHTITAAARALSAALLLPLLACSVDDRTLLVSDAGTMSPPRGILLLPDPLGFVDGTNAAGIKGTWYLFADSFMDHVPPGKCQTAGFSEDQCSTIFTPPNYGVPFPPSDLGVGRMCTSGVAARVLPKASTTAPDYPDLWGAEIGLDLDNEGTLPATARPYDARAHHITGVSFTLDPPASGLMRIGFPTTDSPVDVASWGGAANLVSPVSPGLNVIHWASVAGPFYLTNPPPFDETKLIGVQFSVLTNPSTTTPFDFCVSNLTALVD